MFKSTLITAARNIRRYKLHSAVSVVGLAVGLGVSIVYRTEIEVSVFVMSAAIALVIAILSVSYHAYRTAIKNPTDSLRYE